MKLTPMSDLTLPTIMRCIAAGLFGVLLPSLIGAYIVPSAGGLFIVIALVAAFAGFVVGGMKAGL